MTAQLLDTPAAAQDVRPGGQAQPAFWSGVFAMSLCVFVLIASEFLPVGLLTPVAADLHVSEGWAGYGMTISGLLAVLTSLAIPTLAGALDRKTLLLWLTALMGISCVVVGLAPNYVTYMAGRALIGVVVGGFWSLSAAVAMRLVPAPDVPKALAIFNGGNALASVVAAPMGSYLGGAIGWRGALFCLAPVILITLAWQWASLPSMAPQPGAAARPRNAFSLLRRPVVAWGMLAMSAYFTGQFVVLTYVRPFLETVTRVDAASLTLVFLAMGVAGLAGTVMIGWFLKAGVYRTLIAIALIMAVLNLALVRFGGSLVVAAVLLGLWGLVSTAAPVGWWTWLAKALPKDAEAGGGLMVATIQLSISLGAYVGGALLDRYGYGTALQVSAALLLSCALLALLTARAQRRQAA